MASIDSILSTIAVRFDDEDRKLLRDLCSKIDMLGSRIAVSARTVDADLPLPIHQPEVKAPRFQPEVKAPRFQVDNVVRIAETGALVVIDDVLPKPDGRIVYLVNFSRVRAGTKGRGEGIMQMLDEKELIAYEE